MKAKYFAFLPALPFYFMELLVGLVQALVFTLLCAVFLKLMCSHSEEHGNPTWTTSHHGISVEIAKSNNNTAALSQAEASPATGRVPTRQS